MKITEETETEKGERKMKSDENNKQQCPKILQSMLGAMADLGKEGIAKDRTAGQEGGRFGGFKFRGIDDIYNAVSRIFVQHSILVRSQFVNRNVREIEVQRQHGKSIVTYVTLDADISFVSAIDGSTFDVRVYGEAMDNGDKATNKAMSIALKYAVMQAFMIPTEGDNDPDATIQPPRVAPVKASAAVPPKPKKQDEQLGGVTSRLWAPSPGEIMDAAAAVPPKPKKPDEQPGGMSTASKNAIYRELVTSRLWAPSPDEDKEAYFSKIIMAHWSATEEQLAAVGKDWRKIPDSAAARILASIADEAKTVNS